MDNVTDREPAVSKKPVFGGTNVAHIPESSDQWETTEAAKLSESALIKLFQSKLPLIRVPEFLTKTECSALLEAMDIVGWDEYKDHVPPIGKIGTTQFENRFAHRNEYFQAASEATAKRQRISDLAGVDPMERMIELIRTKANGKIDFANEPGQGKYFGGLVRESSNSIHLHFDFGQLDGRTWEIGKIVHQVAFNVYLTKPISGGECIAYDRQWNWIERPVPMPGTYGYDPRLVEGARSVTVKPDLGEMTLINTQNYHEVRSADSRRITMSCFIGMMAEGEMVIWS